MVLAIRLARWGQRGRPFYRIVVADKVKPRDGKYIEKVRSCPLSPLSPLPLTSFSFSSFLPRMTPNSIINPSRMPRT